MAAVLKRARAAVPAQTRVLDQGHLKRLVGYNLRRAEVQMRGLVARVLDADDIRAVEYSILSLLVGNAEVTQKDLGEALAVKRPNLVSLVDRLERRGLIERAVMPRDRRNHLLALTSEGRALALRLDARLDALEVEVFGQWSTDEREQFKAFLRRLHGA